MQQEPTYPKKAKVVILFADNVNFKPRMIRRDKEGHYVLVRGKIQKEEITIFIYMHQIQNTQLCKASINRNEKSNKQ